MSRPVRSGACRQYLRVERPDDGEPAPSQVGVDSEVFDIGPTVAALADLPAVLDVPTAGRLLGLSRSVAYELVQAGTWPTPVLRLGRRYRIPTAPLLTLLGLTPPHWSHPGATMVRSPTALDGDPNLGDRT